MQKNRPWFTILKPPCQPFSGLPERSKKDAKTVPFWQLNVTKGLFLHRKHFSLSPVTLSNNLFSSSGDILSVAAPHLWRPPWLHVSPYILVAAPGRPLSPPSELFRHKELP